VREKPREIAAHGVCGKMFEQVFKTIPAPLGEGFDLLPVIGISLRHIEGGGRVNFWSCH
jgi:hypothetical protein